MRPLWTALTAALTLLPLGAATATPASAQDSRPVPFSGVTALTNAALRPDTAPPGSNDWTCEPTAAHPRPVVLVHGTVENMTYNWDSLSPLLANAGYCVFAFNYGQSDGLHAGLPGSARTGGVAPVADSARELSSFVDRVRKAAGTPKVDIVGHSQGGMMPRYYLKSLDGRTKVDKLVALAPSNHGTTVNGLSALPGVPALLTTGMGPSVKDQLKGSVFLTDLNKNGDTVPGVDYTVITTKLDEVVTPYTSAFLNGPNVKNITLQDRCPTDLSDHLAISFNRTALREVLNALDPAHTVTPTCHPVLPVNGG